MKDRFANGLVAGLIGGIIMDIVNYAVFLMNWSNLLYLDWAGILILGHRPTVLSEEILSQIVQLVFSAFMGVIFAFLIKEVSSRYYLLKGAFLGIISWFFIYAVAIAIRLPSLEEIPFKTAATNFLGSIVFGLIIVQILYLLDKHRLIRS